MHLGSNTERAMSETKEKFHKIDPSKSIDSYSKSHKRIFRNENF